MKFQASEEMQLPLRVGDLRNFLESVPEDAEVRISVLESGDSSPDRYKVKVFWEVTRRGGIHVVSLEEAWQQQNLRRGVTPR